MSRTVVPEPEQIAACRSQSAGEPVPILDLGEPHHRIALTTGYLTRDGRPWIPVSGEMHYSRIPRERWRERLLLVGSGGVDVVSTYVIWLHHEPERGRARFDGQLDVAGFVRLCGDLGLHVVLRLGPWVHAEVRNGGFPDWVQQAPVRHRTDDPNYLALVRDWFGQLGRELAGLCGPDSPVIGLQVENELYDDPGHLRTLKRLAREAGLRAPLWTATAWGGAKLPAGEVFPLWSGYGDGFWVDARAGWDRSFRAHFFFSSDWDDPGVGADVRALYDDRDAEPLPPSRPEPVVDSSAETGPVAPPESVPAPQDRSDLVRSGSAATTGFPPATCELGGGMATTYHRRIVPAAADIAAVANAKLGSGSVWQGYYMYAGGLNPAGIGPSQESHATGYPNDLPVTDYDFHAAIGAAGLPSDSHAALRRGHAFIEAFGAELATMATTLPQRRPDSVADTSTARWAVRSAGDSGFVFVNWHQPHVRLPVLRDVRFTVELATTTVRFDPVDLPPGTVTCWPVGLAVGGLRLDATAGVLTRLDEATLVLAADPGIDVHLRFDPQVVAEGVGSGRTGGRWRIPAGRGGVVRLSGPGGAATVIVLADRDAEQVWVVNTPAGRQVLLCADPLWVDGSEVVVSADRPPLLSRVTVAGIEDLVTVPAAVPGPATPLGFRSVRRGPGPSVGYGSAQGRASAPDQETVRRLGDEYRLGDVGRPEPGTRRLLEIAWAGDVAHLCVDGEVVADRFWDGSCWVIDLDAIAGAEGERLGLRLLGLHPQAEIWLDAAALDRSRATEGPSAGIDGLTVSRRVRWTWAVRG